MLVQIGPDKSVAHVVQIFKGGTSRFLRKKFAELEEFLWRHTFLADGYFSETVGIAQEEMIKRYIRDQGVG
jgi:REP element-mobilizing transposase RayT